MAMCSFGLPVGCPISSCSSPPMSGYFPSRMRVPGGMCCVIRSRSYGLKPPSRGVRSGFGSTINFERSGSSNASIRVAREVSLKIKTESQRHRTKLVFGLHENSVVFRQLAPEGFHDGRPRRDWISGAVAHTGGDESVCEGLIAVHRDLRASTGFGDVLKSIMLRQDVSDRVSVTGLERH